MLESAVSSTKANHRRMEDETEIPWVVVDPKSSDLVSATGSETLPGSLKRKETI